MSAVDNEDLDPQKLKEEGNVFLKAQKYALAAEKYTNALDLQPHPIYYANRAQAMIKLESYGSAISDANEAIKMDSSYIKAYYRRGSAHFALGKYKEALKDFQSVARIVPKDPDAIKKLKSCEKAVKAIAFSKALEVDYRDQAITSMDISHILVEDSYDGPRLPDEIDENGGINVPRSFIVEMIEYFKSQKLIHRKYVLLILRAARDIFSKSSSLLRLSLPEESEGDEKEKIQSHFTVCGDTHGQYYDFCNILLLGGFPSSKNPYLFNGDFVDRGSFSFEVVFTLIAIKVSDPDAIFMLRGNHETKNMNKIYGFEGEILHKYDILVYNLFSEVFSWLPLAAVIQDSIFVVHGGLSTKDDGNFLLEEIENIDRGKEPPETGLMSDLLWSDPQHLAGRSRSKRGVGFSFGPDITQNFLDKNNLNLLVRSHEVKDEGYVIEHDGNCITIFSAPNYCDSMGNKGAFIRFETDLIPRFTQFEAVPHPNVPPMRLVLSQ